MTGFIKYNIFYIISKNQNKKIDKISNINIEN